MYLVAFLWLQEEAKITVLCVYIAISVFFDLGIAFIYIYDEKEGTKYGTLRKSCRYLYRGWRTIDGYIESSALEVTGDYGEYGN